jgi:glycopeptide antibiotics resistance protein
VSDRKSPPNPPIMGGVLRRVVLLLALIPIGLLGRKLPGIFGETCGGVFYVLFFALLLTIPFPKLAPWKAALLAYLYTCGVELLQLWHPLDPFRVTLLGKILLGNMFSPTDFVFYTLGGLVSWWVLYNLYNTKHE